MASPREPKRARPSGLNANVTSLDLASLGGYVCSIAVAPSGIRFACTGTALFAITKCGMQALLAGHRTERGFKDGQGGEARFNGPHGIMVDGDGNLLVSDTDNHALRKVTPSGAVSTLAGNGQAGFADGVGAAARFNEPWGIVVDSQGAIFVADSQNHCVRQVAPGDGEVTTPVGVGGEEGFADGQHAAARFQLPCGLALDMDDHLIVGDVANDCIRKVSTADGRVTTVAGRAGQEGFADGEGEAARFNSPQGVAVDGNNNILVADVFNHRIRMIAGANAWVTTVSGSSETGTVDGASARFNEPMTVALDEGGRLLVLEGKARTQLRVVEASLAPPLLLAPKVLPAVQHPLEKDYGKLLEDTELADVTFTVDGQRFPAHRCVLAARSPYFSGLFKSCKGMSEGGRSAAGQDIVIEEVSAGAFRALQRFLYTNDLPEEEDCGEGLEVGEMARVADRFQAVALYEQCVKKFREGLKVGNVVAQMVQAHDSGLEVLQEAAMSFFEANAVVFHVRFVCTACERWSVVAVCILCVKVRLRKLRFEYSMVVRLLRMLFDTFGFAWVCAARGHGDGERVGASPRSHQTLPSSHGRAGLCNHHYVSRKC